MAELVYRAEETAVSFSDSGSGDVAITLNNLAAGAGRVSAQRDRGAGSKPLRHRFFGSFQFDTAPVVGEQIEIYLFESDGTVVDGAVGTTDAALTTEKRRNGKLIGCVIVDQTSANVGTNASFPFNIYSRYYSIGVWNGTADNLDNANGNSYIKVAPMPDEIQS